MEQFSLQSMNHGNLQTPISFNDFNILEQLSNSSFSSVYKAIYKKTGQIYALKAKKQEIFKKKEKEIDYLREKTILYDLTKNNYYHAVKLYGDFQDNNNRYLVMEFCEGISLDKLRGNAENRGYVDQRLVIHILTQMLEILSYLHDNCHIMHRDIIPNNIILGKDNNIKLLGFGISAYLSNENKELVSNKSSKFLLSFAPPEILFNPSPLNYDYKVDIYSLGFTIYSLMNPSQGSKLNLPKETVNENGGFKRYENNLVNNFYEPWLIHFVAILYDNDQSKRPTAFNALNFLKEIQANPSKKETIKNFHNNRNRDRNVPMHNLNIANNSSNNQINNNNKVSNQSNPLMEQQSQPVFPNDNKVISSMKSLIFILYKMDSFNFIKAQLSSLLSNSQINNNQLITFSFCRVLDAIKQVENGQLNITDYDKIICDFIKNIFNKNNSGISGTRPIILYYMMSNIFKNESLQYFNNIKGNNIFDDIIKNNFEEFNIILPMNNPKISKTIKEKILDFKKNYKDPFTENFCFLILNLSKCPSCESLFGISGFNIAMFLQLDVLKLESNVSDLIKDYFTPKIDVANYNCSNCGCQGKKLRQKFCLNLPNYLFLELEDKNKINFNEKISVPLYNGKTFVYDYYASIYKIKINETMDFCAVIKIGNNYYFYSNNTVQQVPEKYIFLERPSLALYKRVLN